MLKTIYTDNAKIMAKGQVTIPKDIRNLLGVSCGDRITFIVEGNTVRIVNSAVYAMQILQNNMINEAVTNGINSEEDVDYLIRSIRNN